MDSIKFIQEFERIKPSFKEILSIDMSLSEDVVTELTEDFNLRLTSLVLNNDPILDLILNTNICSLYFSKILFVNDFRTGEEIMKIGYVMEMADLYFDNSTKCIIINSVEDHKVEKSKNIITQTDFLKCFLKYLEIHFNSIFRKNKVLKYIEQEVDSYTFKNNPLFKMLLDEIEK